MTISEEKKYLFVAVPKTGTTTIHTYLKNYDNNSRKNFVMLGGRMEPVDNHARFSDLEEIMGNRIHEFTSFAFLREPYDRLFSYYRYIIRPKEQRKSYPLKAKFVRTVCKLMGFKMWALFYPLDHSYPYLLDKNGKVAVDFIGRTESLKDDFVEICSRANLDVLKNIDMMVQMRMTTKSDMSHHLSSAWFKKRLDKRIARDLAMYEKIRNKIGTPEDFN